MSRRSTPLAVLTQDVHLSSATHVVWFRKRLLNWFEENGRSFPWRKRTASNYTKILSEVLLQRTRAETVARFLPKFIVRFPSWTALSKSTKNDLQKYLQPIGLWRRRSESLKKLADVMTHRRGIFPRTREEIEELPNVGQYIANAILLFCHSEHQPLLDTNMARVLERVFGPRGLADIRYDPYLQALAKAVVDTTDPIVMNWAILDCAALICRISKPRCNDCPLLSQCRFASENHVSKVGVAMPLNS